MVKKVEKLNLTARLTFQEAHEIAFSHVLQTFHFALLSRSIESTTLASGWHPKTDENDGDDNLSFTFITFRTFLAIISHATFAIIQAQWIGRRKALEVVGQKPAEAFVKTQSIFISLKFLLSAVGKILLR